MSSFTRYHQNKLESKLLQGEHSVLDGDIGVKDLIRENISRYLEDHFSLRLFSAVNIKVFTSSGELVYPVPSPLALTFASQQQIASENYRLLEAGLAVVVTLYTQPDAPLSVGALFLFTGLALGGLNRVYRRQVAHVSSERRERELTIASLTDGEKLAGLELEALNHRQETLLQNLEKARKGLVESNESQSELLDEIECLEELLEENEEKLVIQKSEIEMLTKMLCEPRAIMDKKPGKRKNREKESTAKRLKVLYKHLRVHDRALKGFLDLEEGMRLKCEEVIHQLNGDPDCVTVKRKVFGGRGIDTFFEAEFAYKGRIYFTRHSGGVVEVVAIGTKNSQASELGFLHRISGEVKPA
ncbi:hypothetical protein DSLASN_27120 [Desulfoluna limicola]|uniref:Uncharacterized protein n=1 Tax=Desulfoluna limicola TaxID=2810562 RepID=A0ABM7PIR6_9BACT|nr:hypothetical protein [Desulfoluna limicola]BCS97080.1 hypothetical protein DSLASN_27120 [Desulfoluna limicola]